MLTVEGSSSRSRSPNNSAEGPPSAESAGETQGPQDENERSTRQNEHHGAEESAQPSIYLDPRKCVTLICFGASPNLRGDLEFAVSALDWREITHDPVILYDVIFSELYSRIVFKMSGLIHVYRGIRQVCSSPHSFVHMSAAKTPRDS